MKWVTPVIRGASAPAPRIRHAAACCRDKVFIFGGQVRSPKAGLVATASTAVQLAFWCCLLLLLLLALMLLSGLLLVLQLQSYYWSNSIWHCPSTALPPKCMTVLAAGHMAAVQLLSAAVSAHACSSCTVQQTLLQIQSQLHV